MTATHTDTGVALADTLQASNASGDVVLATSADSHPVGQALAAELGVPVGRLVARELGVGGDTVGAVASDGSVYLDDERLAETGATPGDISQAVTRAQERAREEASTFDQEDLLRSLEGTTVVLVDDGAVDPAVVLACVRNARAARASRVTVAVPEASSQRLSTLQSEADSVVCPESEALQPFAQDS